MPNKKQKGKNKPEAAEIGNKHNSDSENDAIDKKEQENSLGCGKETEITMQRNSDSSGDVTNEIEQINKMDCNKNIENGMILKEIQKINDKMDRYDKNWKQLEIKMCKKIEVITNEKKENDLLMEKLNDMETKFDNIRMAFVDSSKEIIRITNENKKINEENLQMSKELSKLREQLNNLIQITENIRSNKEVTQKKIEENISEMDKKMDHIENKIDNLDQYGRRSNLLIGGIPERKEENLDQILLDIAKKIEVEISRNDYEAIHRLGNRKRIDRDIIVKFVNRQHKEQFFINGKKKALNLRDIKIDHIGPIYFNEHLTDYKRELFIQTKRKGREYGWKFIWVKNGQIRIRKSENSRIYMVRDYNDLLVLEKEMTVTNDKVLLTQDKEIEH